MNNMEDLVGMVAAMPGIETLITSGVAFQHFDLRPDANDQLRSEWPKTNPNLSQDLIDRLEHIRKNAPMLMLGELIPEEGGQI